MAPAATVGQNSGDFGHGRAREVGERKRRGNGFDSVSYAQWRCIVEIEFRGGICNGRSIHGVSWKAALSYVEAACRLGRGCRVLGRGQGRPAGCGGRRGTAAGGGRLQQQLLAAVLLILAAAQGQVRRIGAVLGEKGEARAVLFVAHRSRRGSRR
jgi:hypothetical protein